MGDENVSVWGMCRRSDTNVGAVRMMPDNDQITLLRGARNPVFSARKTNYFARSPRRAVRWEITRPVKEMEVIGLSGQGAYSSKSLFV